jgi:ATP-dependent exoDNAse (exonuclease V) alpha subunit
MAYIDQEEQRRKGAKIALAASELSAAGMDQSQALEAAEAGVNAISLMSQHKSVLTGREWDTAFSRLAGQGWLDNPKWGEFRKLIARSVGLIPLAAAQEDKLWAKWSPAWHEKAEHEMIALAKREDPRHGIPKELVDQAIAKRKDIAPEQAEAALASCLGDKAVVVTEGTAGAGKSFTLEVIKEVYQKVPSKQPGGEEGYDIIGAALSWNAAKVLQESAKLDSAQALAGLLIEMDKAREQGRDFFKRRTLVIVDEAGLVGTMKMRSLLRHAADSLHPVRVLLTGDSLQLNPVEAGNALEAIVDECGSSRLDTIRRQERPSHKAAVKHFSKGRAEQGLWTYWQQEALWMCDGAEARRERVMRDYVRNLAAHPMDACLVLALENAEVRRLNEHIRERLKSAGLLAGTEHELEVYDVAGAYKAKFCVGDRIVFRRNLRDQPVHESKHEKIHEAEAAALKAGKRQDGAGLFAKMISGLAGGKAEPLGKELRKGVFNRGSGIILGIGKSPSGSSDRVLRVLLSEGGEVEIDTAALRDKYALPSERGIAMHHNFATTIYASQGQTVQRVLMMDSPYMNRRLAYVGMSRHKIACDVYADKSDLSERKKERAARDLKFTWSAREKERCKKVLEASSFEEGDLWAEMALCWNKESVNPTVLQEKKRMAEKRERASDEGSRTGRLHQAQEDDPEDAHNPEDPDSKPIPMRKKPPSYEVLARAPQSPVKKPGFFESLLSSAPAQAGAPAPFVEPLPIESEELPEWGSNPLAAKAIKELEGLVWGRNRWGIPRLFALDKEGKIAARWSMDGQHMAGRREPPVLPNQEDSPWMVVAGAREALISHAHFQEKWKDEPARAPSIAVAFEAADLSALAQWVKPGQKIFCAWSPKDPPSVEWAKSTAAKLAKLGYKAGIYPKPPEAQAGHEPVKNSVALKTPAPR